MRILIFVAFILYTPLLFGQTAEIADWVRRLGSEEYQEREEAFENLKKAGFRALP